MTTMYHHDQQVQSTMKYNAPAPPPHQHHLTNPMQEQSTDKMTTTLRKYCTDNVDF